MLDKASHDAATKIGLSAPHLKEFQLGNMMWYVVTGGNVIWFGYQWKYGMVWQMVDAKDIVWYSTSKFQFSEKEGDGTIKAMCRAVSLDAN